MNRINSSKWMLTVIWLAMCAAVGAQEKLRIANEGTIGDKWMLAAGAKLVTAVYPSQLASREDNVCISLAYTINPDGKTTDFAVVKQWNSEGGEDEPVEGFWQAFANAGYDAVSQWRFKPRPEVTTPVPTRTVATLGFNGQANVDAAKLRGHCKIADLADHLAQLKRERGTRGDTIKQLQENERLRMEKAIREERM